MAPWPPDQRRRPVRLQSDQSIARRGRYTHNDKEKERAIGRERKWEPSVNKRLGAASNRLNGYRRLRWRRFAFQYRWRRIRFEAASTRARAFFFACSLSLSLTAEKKGYS